MSDGRRSAVARTLAQFRCLCEVGIGVRPDLAAALASDGCEITATDVHECVVPDDVTFVRDDVVAAADRSDSGDHYRVDCVYALNLPTELHRPLVRVAARTDAACCFTTLGGDPPVVDVTPVALADGETLYVARDPDGVLAVR